MTDGEPPSKKVTPDWLPEVESALSPKPQQDAIIESDEYPMRVLAGAGTGKTFTMVRKIEQLVADGEASPDRVLALTFTNNAADSMQEKLHATLGTAGYDVDAYTYHSICNEILRDYAYAAGLDPDFEVATDAEKYAIVLDVLDEVEYRSVKPNVYDQDSWGSGAASTLTTFVSSMKRSGITPEDLDAFLGPAEGLYELEDLPDRIEALASDHLGGRSVGSVRGGIPAVRDGIAAERAALDERGAVVEGETVEGAVDDFLSRLEDLCAALEEAFEEVDDGDRDLPEDGHKLPKYLLGGYASGAPTGIPGDLDLELTDHLRDFLEDCIEARDLTAGYAAYERELHDRNLLDFDGLVVETVDLLDSEYGDEIADRWDYVFCDEFQDTDRLQFDLVTSLVSDEQLFVVGDDDQAIYEWRGANVENITDELDRAFGEALADRPLEENFRSRQPILDLANGALELVEGRADEKRLTRVDEPDYDGDVVATIDEAAEPEDRADQLTTVVQNLLSGDSDRLDKSYDPGDIGLLVRKHKHATPIVEAFEDAGIPYQVAGDLATESVGVGTVVAYLKALARPHEDDVSWNRVLTMRYRLTDGDLRRINEHEESTLDGLQSTPLGEFDEPERVAEARSHATELLDLRERVSLGHLYTELEDLTNLEWYLSEQERRDLDQLDDVVSQFGDGAIQPPLSGDFIETLQHYDALFSESGSAPTSQPELADDAVNVMTIHKSKGLDFPVVLLPRLTADEWSPGTRDYDGLEDGLAEGADQVFAGDPLARDAREQRRLLHVAMTRAEDILVLQGGADEEEEIGEETDASGEETDASAEELGRPVFDCVRDVLPPTLPWEPGSGHLSVWQDLQASLPPSAVDWTDSLAAAVEGDVGGTVRHGDERLSVEDARDRVLALADGAVDGTHATDDAVTPTSPLGLDALTGPALATPSIRHSYTSLETFETCPRQHYLDYVVNAFDDYEPPAAGTYDGASQRDVGLLFHDTAEIAANTEESGPEAWKEIAERLASQRRAHDALPAANASIDRYFEMPLPGWEVVAAERDFELELDGHDIVGFIDTVLRTPDGELVVVDYKATTRRRDLDEDAQVPIYLLACRDLFDEPVRRGGYAYVGEIGPELETRRFDDDDLDAVREHVSETMTRIEATTFDQFDADDHCRWCSHTSLPCAPNDIAEPGGGDA